MGSWERRGKVVDGGEVSERVVVKVRNQEHQA